MSHLTPNGIALSRSVMTNQRCPAQESSRRVLAQVRRDTKRPRKQGENGRNAWKKSRPVPDVGIPPGQASGTGRVCAVPRHHTTILGTAQVEPSQLSCGWTRFARFACPVVFGWYDSLIGFDRPLIHSGLPQTACPMKADVGFTTGGAAGGPTLRHRPDPVVTAVRRPAGRSDPQTAARARHRGPTAARVARVLLEEEPRPHRGVREAGGRPGRGPRFDVAPGLAAAPGRRDGPRSSAHGRSPTWTAHCERWT